MVPEQSFSKNITQAEGFTKDHHLLPHHDLVQGTECFEFPVLSIDVYVRVPDMKEVDGYLAGENHDQFYLLFLVTINADQGQACNKKILSTYHFPEQDLSTLHTEAGVGADDGEKSKD